MKSLRNIMAASAIATFSMSANASIVSFNDYSAFESAISDPLTFESFETYASNPSYAPIQYFDDFQVAELYDAGDNVIFNSAVPFSASVTDGAESIWTYANHAASTTFFGSGVGAGYAFGAFVTTSKATDVTLTVNGQSFVNSFSANTPEFFGVIGTGETFGNVAFSQSVDGVQLGFDSVSYVGPVPEPSTIALMAGGLGLVGFMAARRRKQA